MAFYISMVGNKKKTSHFSSNLIEAKTPLSHSHVVVKKEVVVCNGRTQSTTITTTGKE